jgi:hypothetical protein
MLSKFKFVLPAIVLIVVVALILASRNASFLTFSHAWIAKALLGEGTGGGGHGMARGIGIGHH